MANLLTRPDLLVYGEASGDFVRWMRARRW